MNKRSIRMLGIIAIGILSSCTPKVEAQNPIILQTLSSQPAYLRSPYTTVEEVEEVILSQPRTIYRKGPLKEDGLSWMAEKVEDGTPRIQLNTYTVAYDLAGNELSRTLIPEATVTIDPVPTIFEYGAKPDIGTVFFPRRIFRYGANCGGCRPNEYGVTIPASLVPIGTKPEVRQADGQMKDGITYEGYYWVASDRNLPMCTMLEISNHRFSGMGLTPGVPFKAIVMDRGVSGNVLDLFVGDETKINAVRLMGVQYPKVEIIGFGELTVNSNNQRICKVD